jgi:VWFA-related protein
VASFRIVILVLSLSVSVFWHPITAGAQTQPESQNKPDQSIPDAPSTVQPPKPAPAAPESPSPGSQNSEGQSVPTEPPQELPANQAPPRDGTTAGTSQTPTAPPVNVKTVPEGGATKQNASGQDEFFKFSTTTNEVMIPVTVRGESGELVNGLLPKDFTVKEDGKKQTLKYFTSDPFALSTAIILDLGMKDVDVQRVNHTFTALQSVFSEFDEVSIYAYSNTVSRLLSWEAAGQKLSDALASVANVRGRNNGPPVTSGPLGPQGPTINNMPVDAAAPTVYTAQQEAHVLNDAILKAALDLGKRDKSRRKVIFVVSDGREYRSDASYRDVLRVLLSNNIILYGVGVGGSAIPGYNKVEKLHIPRFGYSDILPKYVNATGGEVSNELTRTGIEDAYARLIGYARNQYTLGYVTQAPTSGAYRSIEVLVDRPSCKRSSIRPCVDLTAKDGYYAAPPAR